MKKIEGNITEDAFHRIKDMVGSEDDDEKEDKIRDINLVFSTTERLDIYNHIIEMLKAKEEPHQIATNVVGFLNERLADRVSRAKKRKKGKSPIFRRID